MNVLLIESSKSQQSFFRNLFESHQFEVYVADSAELALTMAPSISPDLICSSVSLPGMQGIELCRQFRRKKETSNIPIIMVTSGTNSVVSESLEAGATDVFNKLDIEPLNLYLKSYLKDFGFNHINAGSKVLYVEDSKTTAHVVKSYLKKRSMKVDHYDNAEEAFEAIQKNSYDLVITDIVLLGKNSGLRLVRQIREVLKDNLTPILVLSGFSDTSRIVEVYRSGANDYISKPFIEEELIARTDNLISQKNSVDELRKRNLELRDLAMIDELTGLYNRRMLFELGEKYIKLAHDNNEPFSLAILDIDFFKKVNDTHGHVIGDEILKGFSTILNHSSRDEDIVTRYGGEEFVIIMKSTNNEKAMQESEKLLEEIRSNVIHGISITASAGVASTQDKPLKLGDLLSLADSALYKAKNNGRNRVERAN